MTGDDYDRRVAAIDKATEIVELLGQGEWHQWHHGRRDHLQEPFVTRDDYDLRVAAIDKATEIVERMGSSEDLNKRGYKIDGWKPMTGPERADAIVKLAEFLIRQRPYPSNLTAPETLPT